MQQRQSGSVRNKGASVKTDAKIAASFAVVVTPVFIYILAAGCTASDESKC